MYLRGEKYPDSRLFKTQFNWLMQAKTEIIIIVFMPCSELQRPCMFWNLDLLWKNSPRVNVKNEISSYYYQQVIRFSLFFYETYTLSKYLLCDGSCAWNQIFPKWVSGIVVSWRGTIFLHFLPIYLIC